MAGCYTGIRPPILQAQFPQILTALDFFHIPEKLWPTALKVLPRVKANYDEATATAHRLVSEMLDSDFEDAWLDNSGVLHKRSYALCKSEDGLLKLQYKDSPDELCKTTNPVVIDPMLEAALQDVATINGLKLDIHCEDNMFVSDIHRSPNVCFGGLIVPRQVAGPIFVILTTS